MNQKRILIFLTLLLTSCSLFPPKPSEELEKISEDVLKSKQGIEIDIVPKPMAKS